MDEASANLRLWRDKLDAEFKRSVAMEQQVRTEQRMLLEMRQTLPKHWSPAMQARLFCSKKPTVPPGSIAGSGGGGSSSSSASQARSSGSATVGVPSPHMRLGGVATCPSAPTLASPRGLPGAARVGRGGMTTHQVLATSPRSVGVRPPPQQSMAARMKSQPASHASPRHRSLSQQRMQSHYIRPLAASSSTALVGPPPGATSSLRWREAVEGNGVAPALVSPSPRGMGLVARTAHVSENTVASSPSRPGRSSAQRDDSCSSQASTALTPRAGPAPSPAIQFGSGPPPVRRWRALSEDGRLQASNVSGETSAMPAGVVASQGSSLTFPTSTSVGRATSVASKPSAAPASAAAPTPAPISVSAPLHSQAAAPTVALSVGSMSSAASSSVPSANPASVHASVSVSALVARRTASPVPAVQNLAGSTPSAASASTLLPTPASVPVATSGSAPLPRRALSPVPPVSPPADSMVRPASAHSPTRITASTPATANASTPLPKRRTSSMPAASPVRVLSPRTEQESDRERAPAPVRVASPVRAQAWAQMPASSQVVAPMPVPAQAQAPVSAQSTSQSPSPRGSCVVIRNLSGTISSQDDISPRSSVPALPRRVERKEPMPEEPLFDSCCAYRTSVQPAPGAQREQSNGDVSPVPSSSPSGTRVDYENSLEELWFHSIPTYLALSDVANGRDGGQDIDEDGHEANTAGAIHENGHRVRRKASTVGEELLRFAISRASTIILDDVHSDKGSVAARVDCSQSLAAASNEGDDEEGDEPQDEDDEETCVDDGPEARPRSRSVSFRTPAVQVDVEENDAVHAEVSRPASNGSTPKARCGRLDSGLFTAAFESVVPPQAAKHPGRAGGAVVLLHSAKRASKEPPSAANGKDYDDGSSTVRLLFFDSVPEECVEIAQIEQVMQPSLLRRFLERVAAEKASIEVTFHGTRAEHVPSIMQHGLDPKMCHTGAYGRGAYVGTHAGIAHQYADPDHGGWKHMFIFLVVVGTHVVKGREGEQAPVTAMDRLMNPTQYCLVDADRLYVSHLIRYRVTDPGGTRVGGGWEDPFQRQLNLAIFRAAQYEQKSGHR